MCIGVMLPDFLEYLSNGKMNKMLGQSSVQQADKPSFVMTLEMTLPICVLGKAGHEASSHHNLFSAECCLRQRVPLPAGSSFTTPRRG